MWSHWLLISSKLQSGRWRPASGLILADGRRRRYTKEESPELMPEDDDMLAAFAAAVDASCIEVNLGMAGMGHDGGEEDVVMEVEVEEDTDE